MSIQKKIALVLFMGGTLLFATPQKIEAKGNFGLGLMAGEPSGVTLKFNNFPVIGIGYNFLDLSDHITKASENSIISSTGSLFYK